MICIDAEQLQDGLYNIKNGKIYKYKAKGGTARVYKLESRPKGKWIEVTNGRGGHECSNCHEYAPSYMSGDEHLSDFCPYCGAHMKGADDEYDK